MLIAGIVASASIAGSAAPAAEDGAGPAENPQYVALDEIAAPIVGTDRIEGTLKVKLVLEAASTDAAEQLSTRTPELRAKALAATLEFARLHASPFSPVNAKQLRDDLSAAVRQAHPGVAQVLVVELAARSS